MFTCAYCGEDSTCFDHVIPRSYLAVRRRTGTEPGFKVPACNECNSLLQDRIFPNLVERKEYISEQLIKRLDRIASHIPWDDEDKKPLGPNIRHSIEVAMAKREVARDRLRYSAAPPEARWLHLEARWRAHHGDIPHDQPEFDAVVKEAMRS